MASMQAWRELELGLLQGAGEALVLPGAPLGLDEEAEAFVEGEGGEIGLLLLRGPGGRHGVELEGLEVLQRRGGEHRGSPSLVVGRPAEVVVGRGEGELRGGRRHGEAVEAVLEDGVDVAVGAGADGDGAGTGGLEPGLAVALAEPQEAEARAVALLGMRAVREDRLDEGGGLRADRARPRW